MNLDVGGLTIDDERNRELNSGRLKKGRSALEGTEQEKHCGQMGKHVKPIQNQTNSVREKSFTEIFWGVTKKKGDT